MSTIAIPTAVEDTTHVERCHVSGADHDAILREHGPMVWRALRGLGVGEADVEDVCQEVLITVFRRLPTFEGRSTLRTWIYGITLRVAADHRRRKARRRELARAEPPVQRVAPDQELGLSQADARALLGRLLDHLTPEQRDIFVLYELEELPMREVADAVGCPLQTAYSRHKAAQKTLRRAAAELEGDTP